MIEALLRSMPLFAEVPDAELGLIARGLTTIRLPANTLLFREGEPNDRFSIIAEGTVEITRIVDGSTERVLQTLGRGDYYGEMSLLFADSRRSASGRTQTAVVLLEMPRSEFAGLLQRRPALAVEILRNVVERLRNTENAVIADLRAMNHRLLEAYRELQAAQARLIEQERLEYELRTARNIQEHMLPKRTPQVDGWAVETFWQPARSVGGDFYDFLALPDGQLALVTGDVTGKGVPAALVMATTCSLIRLIAEQYDSPGAMLQRINDRLCADMPERMFVTCLLGVLDPSSGQFCFANAGHNLPLLRSGSTVQALRATGMPLGLMPGMDYEEQWAHINRSDTLLLYSDGITEARSAARELFGERRLTELMAAWSPAGFADGSPTLSLPKRILDSVCSFMPPDAEQEDDMTMVVVRRE